MNEKNLKPIKKGQLSKEEAKKRGKKGGIKSGIKRKEIKSMKEMLDYLLSEDSTGENITNLEAIMTATLKKALKGDIKAIQFIRDTIGEMPINRQEIKSEVKEIPPVIFNIQPVKSKEELNKVL